MQTGPSLAGSCCSRGWESPVHPQCSAAETGGRGRCGCPDSQACSLQDWQGPSSLSPGDCTGQLSWTSRGPSRASLMSMLNALGPSSCWPQLYTWYLLFAWGEGGREGRGYCHAQSYNHSAASLYILNPCTGRLLSPAPPGWPQRHWGSVPRSLVAAGSAGVRGPRVNNAWGSRAASAGPRLGAALCPLGVPGALPP